MSLDTQVNKARILIEALPYMRRFDGRTFVIKYGGHAMVDDKLKKAFAQDVILLRQVGINPVVIHGGGPQIGQTMIQMGLKPQFIDGQRVTDQETVNVVEMVLAGKINKDIVNLINLNGGRAAGLSGKDGHTILARKRNHRRKSETDTPEEIIDLGWVGDVEAINTDLLELFKSSDIIPVVAPVGVGKKGETYNINADAVAGHVATALRAEKLILLTDVPGVRDQAGQLISRLETKEALQLIKDGVIVGGMIPKVETCLTARKGGVAATHILDGRIEHALLLEIFTDQGIGTLVV
ncbi:MAG: acetylglutamate kinase [Magnetococcales bacterium]|nr:acetylglutamate kinase [Magnetococcales bacterium]MBF0438083.1 acetylglutamate kinase [Magnetococcales bacterium]